MSRHIPERTCIACRCKRPQHELLRLHKTARGWELSTGVRMGRGSYLCTDNAQCHTEKKLKRLGSSAKKIAEALKGGQYV